MTEAAADLRREEEAIENERDLSAGQKKKTLRTLSVAYGSSRCRAKPQIYKYDSKLSATELFMRLRHCLLLQRRRHSVDFDGLRIWYGPPIKTHILI